MSTLGTTRSWRRSGAAFVLALLALGCGSDDEAPDDGGPTLSVAGTRVRMTCAGGDCFAGVFQDSGAHVVVQRTVGGVTVQRSQLVVGLITDIEVEMGGGNDVFRMYDRYTAGTLRLSMGDGDDLVDFDDGAANGTTHIDLGSGNDELYSNASFPARRFRIDAGSGDDRVTLHHVPFPYANVVLGGDGNDVLDAPTNFAEHAQRIDGFEERNFFCLTIEDCEKQE